MSRSKSPISKEYQKKKKKYSGIEGITIRRVEPNAWRPRHFEIKITLFSILSICKKALGRDLPKGSIECGEDENGSATVRIRWGTDLTLFTSSVSHKTPINLENFTFGEGMDAARQALDKLFSEEEEVFLEGLDMLLVCRWMTSDGTKITNVKQEGPVTSFKLA